MTLYFSFYLLTGKTELHDYIQITLVTGLVKSRKRFQADNVSIMNSIECVIQ